MMNKKYWEWSVILDVKYGEDPEEKLKYSEFKITNSGYVFTENQFFFETIHGGYDLEDARDQLYEHLEDLDLRVNNVNCLGKISYEEEQLKY